MASTLARVAANAIFRSSRVGPELKYFSATMTQIPFTDDFVFRQVITYTIFNYYYNQNKLIINS